MNRVLVLGNAGSGKSTLASALGARLGLDVVHLDRLYWLPGWVERPRADFVAAMRAALPPGGRWICDGNYVNTLDERLPLADAVILLDLPTHVCLRRVIVRTITTSARADLAPGCEEQLFRRSYLDFLRYVSTYRRKMLPRVLAKLRGVANLTVLRNAAEVNAFM